MQTFYVAAQNWLNPETSNEPIQIHLHARLITIRKSVNDARGIGFGL
ncbi:hypothetical protein SPHINGOT1_270097 [Sphingomonas sp. T1]|nr:hypothetical protein SPHINGOT1_270097 [Sphingomonas sp. T1]